MNKRKYEDMSEREQRLFKKWKTLRQDKKSYISCGIGALLQRRSFSIGELEDAERMLNLAENTNEVL